MLFGKIFQIMDDLDDEDEVGKTSINILNCLSRDESLALCEDYLDQALFSLEKILPVNNKIFKQLINYLIHE